MCTAHYIFTEFCYTWVVPDHDCICNFQVLPQCQATFKEHIECPTISCTKKPPVPTDLTWIPIAIGVAVSVLILSLLSCAMIRFVRFLRQRRQPYQAFENQFDVNDAEAEADRARVRAAMDADIERMRREDDEESRQQLEDAQKEEEALMNPEEDQVDVHTETVS
jgi:hypothetical protein